MEDLETYLAWKRAWMAKHKTLEEAVSLARELGGAEYAATVEAFISEMEALLSGQGSKQRPHT